MRIVLLNQYYAPDEAATAQLLGDLGEALAARGHEVRAVCSDRSYADPSRRYASSEVVAGVRVTRLRTSGFGRRRILGRMADYVSFYAGSAARVMLGRRPDVVVSLTTPPMIGAVGVMASRLRGTRSVLWEMDLYPDLAFEMGVLFPNSIVGRVLRRAGDAILRGSDRVVALDGAMARRLRAQGRADLDVVANWADESSITGASGDGSTLRRDWGWQGRFVVLYSGNLGLAHDFSTVLDAADRLRTDPGILFAFVGGGPRKPEVETEVRRRSLPNVEFRPYVPRARLGESLAAGDVHLATLRAGMAGLVVPSKIYGILAAARPTLYVGPDEGNVAEALAAARCGTRIALGDASGLADAVIAYRDDPARRAAEGRAARELFDARYSRRHGVGALVRIVEGAAGARGA